MQMSSWYTFACVYLGHVCFSVLRSRYERYFAHYIADSVFVLCCVWWSKQQLICFWLTFSFLRFHRKSIELFAFGAIARILNNSWSEIGNNLWCENWDGKNMSFIESNIVWRWWCSRFDKIHNLISGEPHSILCSSFTRVDTWIFAHFLFRRHPTENLIQKPSTDIRLNHELLISFFGSSLKAFATSHY